MYNPRSKTGNHLLIIMIIAVAGFSHAAGQDIHESSVVRNISIPFKDGGHADVQYEKLSMSYRTTEGWFQGAGGQPPRDLRDDYRAVTGTVKRPPSRLKKKFGWIGHQSKYSNYIPMPGRLAFAGDDFFIEYLQVPAHISSFHGSGCVETQVKYGRYKGTKPRIKSDTYKWNVEYAWEDVTKDEFERAARSGEVIKLETTGPSHPMHDVCYWWHNQCFEHCPEEADAEYWSNSFYSQVDQLLEKESEKILRGHPEAMHTGAGRNALYRVIENLDPKQLEHAGKGRSERLIRMLDMLLRYNPDINAVHFVYGYRVSDLTTSLTAPNGRNIGGLPRTPLHVAVELGVDSAVRDKLVQRGGRILYPSCGFREVAVAKYPELAKKGVIREIGESEGWVDDDIYQIWQEDTSDIQALKTACGRIYSELKMIGAPDTEVNRKIKEALHFTIACYRRDPNTGKEKWLVRATHPELLDQVQQYQKLQAAPSP